MARWCHSSVRGQAVVPPARVPVVPVVLGVAVVPSLVGRLHLSTTRVPDPNNRSSTLWLKVTSLIRFSGMSRPLRATTPSRSTIRFVVTT